MYDLKKKIFKFGMYGKPVTLLSKEEINNVKDCKWAEFFHEDDLEEIQKNVEFVPRKIDLDGDLEAIYVRMGFPYFRTWIQETRFKEMSSFKIFNYLLITDDYVKQSDLQHVGNVSTAKVSYILKILRKSNLIQQEIIKNVSYVKLDLDKLYKNVKKQLVPPIIPTAYSREVPLYQEIKKKMLNLEFGLMSDDLKKEYGLSVKRAHSYLKKIKAENPDKIGIRTVFDGRTRRQLFHRIEGNSIEEAIKEKGYVTTEDRIRALRQLLADKKWIGTCDKMYNRFKELLGTRHTPDKKTMISTAIKANLKVFNIKGAHSTSNFIIANEDVELKDILRTKIKDTIEDNEFSKLVKSKYVMNSNFISIDNSYESKLSARSEIICKHLSQNSLTNLTDEFLMSKPLSFLLKIVPFYRLDFLKNLKEELYNLGGVSVTDESRILEAYSIQDVLDSSMSTYLKKEFNERMKDKKLLKCFLEPFVLSCLEIYLEKEVLSKIKDKLKGKIKYNHNITVNDICYLEYKPLNKVDMNVLISNIQTCELFVKLKKVYTSLIQKRKKLERPTIYVPIEDRWKLYYSAHEVSSRVELDNLIARHIQANKYVPRQDLIRFFTNKFGFTADETKFIDEKSKEYLFTKIKYDIYIKNTINPSDYNEYSKAVLQETLSLLYKLKYIKSSYRDFTLENIQPREEIKRRLDSKESLSYLEYYQERDTIYNMYFNTIYDVLVYSGTLEVEELLNKCNVLESFELLNFVTAYEDIFEIEDVDNVKLISLKLTTNPFLESFDDNEFGLL